MTDKTLGVVYMGMGMFAKNCCNCLALYRVSFDGACPVGIDNIDIFWRYTGFVKGKVHTLNLPFFVGKNKLAFASILLSTFLLGASLFTHSSEKFDRNQLHNWKHTEYADFYGKLYKSQSRGLAKDFLYVKVHRVLYQNKDKKITGNLRVTIPHSQKPLTDLNLYAGDTIKISAKLFTSPGFRNFKKDSLDKYLKSQNIHKMAFTKSPLLINKLESRKKIHPQRLLSVIRKKMQEKIEQHFSVSDSGTTSSQGAILEALLLGERRRMDPLITQSLQKSGLYHLFAISGAHIAIISFLLFSFPFSSKRWV